jgi:hypothetical protein
MMQQMGVNGRRWVENRMNWEIAAQHLHRLLILEKW